MSEDVELLEEQKSQDDDQQRDPALDWFLTHCHLHKYPAKSTLFMLVKMPIFCIS